MAVDTPSIPRMPPVQYWVIWVAGGVNLLRLALVGVVGPVVDLVTYGGLAAVYAYLAGRLVRQRWQVRRAVRVLRRLDSANRTAVLNGLDDEQAKAYFEYRLAEHGEPDSVGVVERFEFSSVDRRELATCLWVTIVTAVAVVGTPTTMGLVGAWQVAAYCCTAALFFAVWAIRRGLQQMSRTFEVTPFGLSEKFPDGSVRRLLWGHGVALRNRPWFRRVEVGLLGSHERIEIPYRVVGFDQLVEAIWTKGDFRQEGAA